jgi:HPt (histidine-containing phosphotransfer) domain-containing protein
MAEQDKILGYFLDEAQEHLRTIEEGLANPVALAQPAQLKEVFRAAHSIKGGAAMLDLSVVQQIGHHLEQAFKQVKDRSLVLDDGLQMALQEGLAILRTSLQQLQQNQPPNPELAQDPVFEKIRERLQAIEQVSNIGEDSGYLYADPALEQVFGTYVNQKIQQFVEICQKPQAEIVTKQELQQICQKVGSLGESFEFLAWTNLLISCRLAISNPLNSTDQLQDVIPQAIQQAQMLVLAGKHQAITSTPELEILLTPNALNVTRTQTAFENSTPNPFELEDGLWDDIDPSTNPGFSSSPTTSDFLFEPQMVGPEEVVDDLAEFMELFDEELPIDGTWVQEDDVLAEELSPPVQLDPFWEEDIFARPVTTTSDFAGIVNPPYFDFEQPDDSDLFVEDLPITAVDPVPKMEIVEPEPVVSLTPAAAMVDWSGLLSDIPDEVVMEYDQNDRAASSGEMDLTPAQEMELWSMAEPPLPVSLDPEPFPAADLLSSIPLELRQDADSFPPLGISSSSEWLDASLTKDFDLTDLDTSSLTLFTQDFDLADLDTSSPTPFTKDLDLTDLDASLPTPFTKDLDLADLDTSLPTPFTKDLDLTDLDASLPTPFTKDLDLTDLDTSLPTPFTQDFDLTDLDTSSPTPFTQDFDLMDLELSALNIPNPPPSNNLNLSGKISSPDVLENLDEVFQVNSLQRSKFSQPLVSSFIMTPPPEPILPEPSPPPPQTQGSPPSQLLMDLDYLKELAVFDDLLADTKITDADLADLEQIIVDGNLESELELESLEDFTPASVSHNPIVILDKLTEATLAGKQFSSPSDNQSPTHYHR